MKLETGKFLSVPLGLSCVPFLMRFNFGGSGVVSEMIALSNESYSSDPQCTAGNSRSPNFLQRRGG